MRHGLPPIVKLANGLMVDIERAVISFPRRLKYTVGSRLTAQAHDVALAANRAWRSRDDDARLTDLADSIDSLKLRLQLAQQLSAFASLGQFEALARTSSDLGRQCGGWQKKRISKRQNGQETAPTQRPQILSSRAASDGAST